MELTNEQIINFLVDCNGYAGQDIEDFNRCDLLELVEDKESLKEFYQ